jgi:hypothetical protein
MFLELLVHSGKGYKRITRKRQRERERERERMRKREREKETEKYTLHKPS